VRSVGIVFFVLLLVGVMVGSATVYVPPEHPEFEFCESDHLTDPSPECFEWEVSITPKGVQTCINITIDQDCTANITMYWYNWTYAIETYGWEAALSNPYPDAWVEYYFESGIAVSQRICAWYANVTCRTEGWMWEMNPIFITAWFNCSGVLFNESIMLVFFTEECPVFQYIEPRYNESVCPCCDSMCLGVNNVDGHLMNLTFYRAFDNGSDPGDLSFYQVNEYLLVGNGTYCFCIDGHVDNSSMLYIPVGYNESYFWYVNMTDSVTGVSVDSDYFFFYTYDNSSRCPCGGDDLVDFIGEFGGRGEVVLGPGTPGFGLMVLVAAVFVVVLVLYPWKTS